MQMTLTKEAQRRCDTSILTVQIKYLVARACAGNRKLWRSCKPKPEETETRSGWKYSCKLNFSREGRAVSEAIKGKQFEKIKYIISKAGNASKWSIEGYNEPKMDEPEIDDDEVEDVRPMAVIKKPIDDYFTGLYGFENHRMMIDEAIETAKLTNFVQRRHIVLLGEPGCGKTTLINRYKEMIGAEAYIELDAPGTTKAGAIQRIDERLKNMKRELREAAIHPPILFVEEIEKTEGESLSFLLGILDDRAALQKVTCRQEINTHAPLLLIGTANSEERLRGFASGALMDRVLLLYCQPPSIDMQLMILKREIANIPNGNPIWADKAMEFFIKAKLEKVFSLREKINMVTAGKDRWLNGDFERAILATLPPSRSAAI
jgi:MoxR-like ATPase